MRRFRKFNFPRLLNHLNLLNLLYSLNRGAFNLLNFLNRGAFNPLNLLNFLNRKAFNLLNFLNLLNPTSYRIPAVGTGLDLLGL